MYYQVKDNIHRSAGSGIGLAISKNLAQLMQGDLTVESELEKRFNLLLNDHCRKSSGS